MAIRPHTSKQYESELHGLREKLLQMGAVVEEMIASAVDALVRRDEKLATETIRRDADVDALEMEIDELCVHILALRQPAASDLRFLTMALKIDTDLERMGDLASNIAKRVRDLGQQPHAVDPSGLTILAEKVRIMVDDSLDAFVESDTAKARNVLDCDDEVDGINRDLIDKLMAKMQAEPGTISRDQGLISISKYLERIADHATNISEMVIFATEGRDVRHGFAAIAEARRHQESGEGKPPAA